MIENVLKCSNLFLFKAATASIEGKMSKSLKKLLKKVASKELHEELAVADAKVGNLIQVSYFYSCHHKGFENINFADKFPLQIVCDNFCTY